MSKRIALAKRAIVYTLSLLLILGSFSSAGYAQVNTASRISITVADPQGAVVSDADVVVKDSATGKEYKGNTGSDGLLSIASLPVGTYIITVSAKGFKQTVVTEIKTQMATTSSLTVTLEVGATNEVVTVTGGATLLEKESTTIGSTITGRQITQLPFTSRDALDLVLNLPGTSGGGRPRQSTVNGLPKAALNISLDGINVQDGTGRSGDGFFTYIRPRIDAIEEVRVSNAGQTAESAAGGAVQISFVTKGGTNEYHGGAWWYNRQRAFNANYYFNKISGRHADPNNPNSPFVETPRAQVMVNQWGIKVGGPITPWLKDKAFFFVSYDEFRLPESFVRDNRQVLTPDAINGIFKWADATAPGGIRSINLYDAARTATGGPFPSTPDSTIARVLADIRTASQKGALIATSDPNLQRLTFTNVGGQVRRFPDIRLDFNITSKHHLEAIYHYQDFAGKADFLNNADPTFPEPLPQVFGSQGSDRFSGSTALRSQLSSRLVNEARFGFTGGTVTFFSNIAPGDFAYFGSYGTQFPGRALNFPYGTTPFSRNDNSRRNAPRFEFRDNLSYQKGRHNTTFGFSLIKDALYSQSSGGNVVPGISFGVSSTDPAVNAFNAVPSSLRGNASSLYALLTGRITQVTINGKLNETTKKYSLAEQAIARNEAWEYGFYGQDSFRFRDNLTVNFGLRWEAVLAPTHKNGVYIRPGFDNLFGISGVGGLFRPDTRSGKVPSYVAVDDKTKPYQDDMNNFAPNFGLAWTPRFKNALLKKIFGENDRTVIRGGYSISFFKDDSGTFNGVWATNPGLTSIANLRNNIEFPSGSLLLRNPLPALTTPPDPVFPRAAAVGVGMADFDPNLQTPYVQSWSFGIQREIFKDTVFEVRYVGNHSLKLVGSPNLNEVNIFENGFLQEFIAAQNNLRIFRATNPNCGLTGQVACSFRNAGLSGQVALPIFTASFGSATSSSFSNSNFLTNLDRGEAGRAANTLATTTTQQNARVAAGLPANLFIVNPSVIGAGSFLQTNIGSSYYNSLQLELRRRLANGLLVQGSYVFSRALASSGYSLRDLRSEKVTSSFDLRHAFKVNYVWEMPIGPGRKFLNYSGPAGIIGKILEGWESDGIIRWQSGRQISLSCGRQTFNTSDAGCDLVGIDNKGLQKLIKVRKLPEGASVGYVLLLPKEFIENTQKAFQTISGTPTGPHIAPPTTPGKVGSFIQLYGPSFFRADLSLVKKTRITERTNVEFRAEFLNAFNNINFLIGSPNNDATGVTAGGLTFGQTTQAYQDVSTTNDPGGRLIQFVLRVNF